MTDRGFWVAGLGVADNVRRLMYQTLIWAFVASDDPRGMRAALDAEDRESLADSLIDGVRRNLELGRDLLGGQELVDELEAVELASRSVGRYARDMASLPPIFAASRGA